MDDDDEILASLIEASAGGDRRAFKRLYDREAQRFYRVAFRAVRQPSAAADIVQEAFLQIWQHAARFDRSRGTARAWLISIVRYRALDALRRLSRDALVYDPIAFDPSSVDIVDEFDPLAALAQRRDGARLRACLEALEQPKRRAILLVFSGLSHSEIAARVTAPLGTVKAWIRRGMVSLKACLEA